jgi:hypothetical protein
MQKWPSSSAVSCAPIRPRRAPEHLRDWRRFDDVGDLAVAGDGFGGGKVN